ncbi:hypothetical protein H6G41_00780 [Tolypothrix sp. FACHB-123]|uniref:hypothetical protein n=1 Tax=Tolypothrix sp. FACHB-123 TaxID=2692868 RepID=UPI00168807A1|nr:hypothetical protein [Tolypothrix sp. FACHB-123]MBD2353169.1 hypothetical protein [Tolypothrix sp. FACHB-123]
MVKEAILKSDKIPKFDGSEFAVDSGHIHHQTLASEWQGSVKEVYETASANTPTCIALNFEDLKCFETVERQYESWGVIFENCLAIQPSNPAFPTHSSSTVLMGSPKSGLLEVSFLQPVNWVSAVVTSSQRLVLTAYDRDRQMLAQTVLPGANLANSDSSIPPNTLLSIAANNIHYLTFGAFDGQFTLDNFRFCF